MTFTFYKFASIAVVVLLISGCSMGDKLPFTMQWNVQQGGDLAMAAADTDEADSHDAASACLPEAGSPFHFRKDLLIAGTISATGDIKDLPGLGELTSRRLQSHLDSLDRFNTSAMHKVSFKSMSEGTTARVKQLGRDYSSQFVLKIEIEDLTLHGSNNWLKKVTGRGVKRDVAVKLYIYDTEHGALFYSKQYQDTVSGRVVGYPGNGNTVTTAWFATDLGKQIDLLLSEISLDIAEKLACVPFSSEVIAVKGDEIHIGAGYLHGVRPGETLRAYPSGYRFASQSTDLQNENEVWIRVVSVFPSHSIASTVLLGSNPNAMNRGDVVRAW